MIEDPDRWARLVADPSLIPGAVDETLRHDPSVPVWRRVTRRPVTLGGVELPEGTKLFLWLAAAGRDASVFPEPERFDLQRANARHSLAFGKGIHYCIGAALGIVRELSYPSLETHVTHPSRCRSSDAMRMASGATTSSGGPP